MQFGKRNASGRVDLIAGNRLFASCNRRELTAVRSLGTVVDVEAGRVLLREGDAATEFYVVLTGEASVTGHGMTPRSAGPGQFFGELELLDWGPRASTATAVTAMRLLVFTRVEFRALLSAVPSVAYVILRAQAERLRVAQTSVISLAMQLHPASWMPGDPAKAAPGNGAAREGVVDFAMRAARRRTGRQADATQGA